MRSPPSESKRVPGSPSRAHDFPVDAFECNHVVVLKTNKAEGKVVGQGEGFPELPATSVEPENNQGRDGRRREVQAQGQGQSEGMARPGSGSQSRPTMRPRTRMAGSKACAACVYRAMRTHPQPVAGCHNRLVLSASSLKDASDGRTTCLWSAVCKRSRAMVLSHHITGYKAV